MVTNFEIGELLGALFSMLFSFFFLFPVLFFRASRSRGGYPV
jgi:hypothetical protein